MAKQVKLQGKLIGEIIGDTYLTKRWPINYFRMFNGFGISRSILNRLLEFGVEKIRIIYYYDIHNENNKCFYETSLTKYSNKGADYSHKDGDTQVILSLSEFDSVVDMAKLVGQKS